MIVDLSKFIISPELADDYAEKIGMMMEHYLYRDGLVRYGFQVTRLTVKMGHQRLHAGDPHLFGSYPEAMQYVKSLIARQNSPVK